MIKIFCMVMKDLKLAPIIIIIAFFSFFFPKNVVAFDHFFDGKLTTLIDLETPNDSYFGGSDSAVTQRRIDSSVLIITTQDHARSFFKAAYGGGRSAPGIPNITKSTSSLVVSNSNASLLVGGGLSQSHMDIGLSVDLSINNVLPLLKTEPLVIYGGCIASNPGSTQFIHGSVFMSISNTIANKICGLGNAVGRSPDFIAVGDSVLINLNKTTVEDLIIAGEDKNVNLGGKAFLFSTNSKIGTLWGTKKGNIGGSLSINLDEVNTVNELNLTETGVISGPITVSVRNSFVRQLNLGPVGPASITTPVVLNISGPGVSDDFFSGAAFVRITAGPSKEGLFLSSAHINFFSGKALLLQLGSNIGITSKVTLSMYDGLIRELIFGSTRINNPGPNSNFVVDIVANIAGGTIETITTGKSIFSILNFVQGDTSKVKRTSSAFGLAEMPFIHSLNLRNGSNTVWGLPGTTFFLKVNHFTIEPGSKLSSVPGGKIAIFIGDKMVVDKGTFVPQMIPGSPTALTIDGNDGSSIEVRNRMSIDLSYSPELDGKDNIPLVEFGPRVNRDKPIFQNGNTIGLLWCDCEFNQNTLTWYARNIRPSQDFYGISAARNASSWLRRQQIWNVQNHSMEILDQGTSGLWVNTQGGHEKLYTSVGKSRISWSTSCMGYDLLQPLTNDKLKALYGFSFCLGIGGNRWNTVNTTKNAIYAGMIDGYCGLIHDSGIYGTASLQLSTSKTTIDSRPGFETKQKMTEIVPAEALELGWRHTLSDRFKVTTRGQIIFEQLPKKHLRICGNDTISFNNTLSTTTSLGIIGRYDFLSPILTNLQASIEWIKGVSRDFSVTSKVVKKTFKENDRSSVFRTSLGVITQINEQFYMHCNVFADAGDNKGIAGQVSLTYNF